MSLVKKAGLLIVVILIAIQFIRPARNRSGQMLQADISKTVAVPVPVQLLLQTACYDCHSNKTNYPWYANVEPIGWILSGHVLNGKKELNFSEFGAYSIRRQQSKLKAVADQLSNGAMPLPAYLLMHKNARISVAEKALIIDWAIKTKDQISEGSQSVKK